MLLLQGFACLGHPIQLILSCSWKDLDEEEPGLTHSMFQRLLRSYPGKESAPAGLADFLGWGVLSIRLELQINQQAKQAMEEKLSSSSQLEQGRSKTLSVGHC